MARIIATAENYAFGPASKLITVCQRLLEDGHDITFIGEGTAYQLASKVKFNKIYHHDTDSKGFMTWGKEIFKQADVLISSVDRSSVKLAKEVGLPIIWIDMLFWWWDEIPDYLLDVDLYIQQNSVKNERNMKKFGKRIKNLVTVGPIIDTSQISTPPKKQLLVGFGGTEAAGWYKIGKDSNYPYTISKMIIEDVDTSRYERVFFAGNEKIMFDISKKYGSKKFQFGILPHDQWLKEMSSSQDLLIHPGLETVLEVVTYNKPAFFLPPDNSSAYLELDEFRELGVANLENSSHFSDYFPHRKFSGRNLRVIMAEYLKELKTFENSPKILRDCAKKINNYIHMPASKKHQQITSQRQFLKRLGDNGLDETVSIINNCLDTKST